MRPCKRCGTEVCAESERIEIHTAVRIINRQLSDGMPDVGIVWRWSRWDPSERYSYEVLAEDGNGRPWRVDTERCEMRVLENGSITMGEREILDRLAKRAHFGWAVRT